MPASDPQIIVINNHEYRFARRLGGQNLFPVFLIENMGHGGLGGRLEVLKIAPVARSESYFEDAVQQLRREVHATSTLSCSPAVYDEGNEEHIDPRSGAFLFQGSYDPARMSYPFFRMEYVEGRDLDSWIRSRRPVAERLAVAQQCAAALDELRRIKFVHRDLKPANMMVVTSSLQVKIIDFGWVKLQEGTRTMLPMGTPLYAPLELLDLAIGVHDHRTDVYSLCVILWELLTGAHPYADAAPEWSMLDPKPFKDYLRSDRPTEHVTQQLEDQLEGTPWLSRDLLQLLARGLSADPAARPTCSQLLGEARLQRELVERSALFFSAPLVVSVGDGKPAGGSAVMVGPGLALSALHVVQGAQRVLLLNGDGAGWGQTIWSDKERDLALLETGLTSSWLEPWDAAPPPPGTEVVVIGFPQSLAALGQADFATTFLCGKVKTPHRAPDRSYTILHDAPTAPGSSGSPVLARDTNGSWKVLGIHLRAGGEASLLDVATRAAIAGTQLDVATRAAIAGTQGDRDRSITSSASGDPVAGFMRATGFLRQVLDLVAEPCPDPWTVLDRAVTLSPDHPDPLVAALLDRQMMNWSALHEAPPSRIDQDATALLERLGSSVPEAAVQAARGYLHRGKLDRAGELLESGIEQITPWSRGPLLASLMADLWEAPGSWSEAAPLAQMLWDLRGERGTMPRGPWVRSWDRGGRNSLGMEFRHIPAGSFTMDAPQEAVLAAVEAEVKAGTDRNKARGWHNARQHQVTITRPFLLGSTPVTRAQWMTVVDTDPSRFKHAGLQAPVERVSWFDAVKFCNLLSEREGVPEQQWAYLIHGEQGTPGKDYTFKQVR